MARMSALPPPLYKGGLTVSVIRHLAPTAVKCDRALSGRTARAKMEAVMKNPGLNTIACQGLVS